MSSSSTNIILGHHNNYFAKELLSTSLHNSNYRCVQFDQPRSEQTIKKLVNFSISHPNQNPNSDSPGPEVFPFISQSERKLAKSLIKI